MFYTFLFIFQGYCISILFAPIYKFFMTPRLYVLINCFFLSLLCLSAVLSLPNVSFFSSHLHFLFDSSAYLSQTIDINFHYTFGPLSIYFSLLVILIGIATNIYSLFYFKYEAEEFVFLWILNAFIASMVHLTLSNNFYSLFFGWEMIGITSYFLINFWRHKPSTFKSSIKAFSFNLVSDIFLIASFVCFYLATGATNFEFFYHIVKFNNMYDSFYIWYGSVFLIICSSIKSVQICGHLWLPDSMEAPVPASSLIHSATLVSAGVFLLCKFSFLICGVGFIQVVALIGAATAALGGLVSAAQTDLKKLLAYSTMSHCGFLWYLSSLGNLYPVIIYLYIHGFLKAVTFFCSGSFIRSYGTQDSRWMGSSHVITRLDTFFLIFSGANLAGLPMTLGFYYKYIFFNSLIFSTSNSFCGALLIIGMLSSLIYFYRLVFYVTFDYYKNTRNLPQIHLKQNRYFFNEIFQQTAFNHFFAVFLIFFYVFVSYFFFYYLSSVCYVYIDDWFNLSEDISTNPALNSVYLNFFLIFYVLYLILVLLIFLLAYKRNIYYVEFSFIIIFILCIAFFTFF